MHMELNDHWHWFASLGCVWGLDLFILDMLICCLGKHPAFLKIFRMKGYYIDYELDCKMKTLDMD